jgi:aspartate dehydrogenase
MEIEFLECNNFPAPKTMCQKGLQMSIESFRNVRRVAIAGLGPIGIKVMQALDNGIDGLALSAVAVGNPNKKRPEFETLSCKPQIVQIADLSDVADIVVECAPASLLRSIVQPFLIQGKMAVVLSAGAILDNFDLIDLAKAHGGQIAIPTGALIGLDAMTAAAQGIIRSVRMTTRKPVKGLLNAPYVLEKSIDLENLGEPRKIFEGTARQAAKGFPANLNVAAALSLAGFGPDRTIVEIWADPNIDRNTHRIEVDADSARFSMLIENVPSENPKTGRITALSVIAYLRKINAPLRIGT